MKDLRTELRRAIRQTDGHVGYYLFYKGLTIYLGDNRTPNKFILGNVDPTKFMYDLQDYRAQSQRVFEKTKYIELKDIDQRFSMTTKYGFPIIEQPYVQAMKFGRRQKVMKFKKPKTTDSYVGLELEYASSFSLDDIADKLVEAGLHDAVRIMHDGSIRTSVDYPYQVEFCILAKFSELDVILDKMRKIITPDAFDPNSSCGFHVHLDARIADVKQMYHNLVCMQSMLFKMSAEHRQDNGYCRPVATPNFDDANGRDGAAHYAAISKFSYYKHNTIEVRIHESTTDLTNVSKWVKLLKKISDYKGKDLLFGNLKTNLKQLANLKLEPELQEYITLRTK